MQFNSVEQVLVQLETQPGWEKFRQYRQLLKCWDRVIDRQNAPHTRPLYINRQILYVATDSAARAQELSFQRYALLKRLNQQLTFKIQDLRFSSSQWHQKTYSPENQPPLFTTGDPIGERHSTGANAPRCRKATLCCEAASSVAKQLCPSRGCERNRQSSALNQSKIKPDPTASLESIRRHETERPSPNSISPQDKAKNAALSWLRSIEQRTESAVFCPQCEAATSEEELARWNLCHHCAARKWSKEYRPPIFPERK